MRIWTKAGDLAFKTFTFPDGQPHFKLETYEREFDEVTIETSIKDSGTLLLTLLVSDVLRDVGYSKINLDIRYLLGARMDRSIDWSQPFTLRVVARLLNGAGFSRVRILDAHSEVATRLIRNSVNILPIKIVEQVYTTLGHDTVIVTPDHGAGPRVRELMRDWIYRYCICEKVRNAETGELSGFFIKDGGKGGENVRSRECLILDDICDGGGTFTGLAKILKDAGATKVNLFVTHGIFSKGLPLEGIDHVYTTDSYVEKMGEQSYRHFHSFARGSVIPISMKDLA